MGQIKFITSMMLITLFTIAIVSYAINFGEDNDAVIKLGDDTEFSSLKSTLDSDVVTYKTTSNASAVSVFKSIIIPAQVTTEAGNPLSIFSTMSKTLKTVGGTVTNKIFGGKGSEFGVIMTGFIALMLVISVLYVIKTWWGRNPD